MRSRLDCFCSRLDCFCSCPSHLRGIALAHIAQARIVKAPSMASAAPAAPESTDPSSILSTVGDDGEMRMDTEMEFDRSELVRLITQSLKTLGYG